MKVYQRDICKFDFFDTAVSDILRALDGGSLMGSYILGFCCIDYMGMAIDPGKDINSSRDFKAFVTKYMGEVDPLYRALTDHLWASRNSVIHVYGLSKSTKDLQIGTKFCPYHSGYHLRIISDPNPQLWLDLPDFVGDIVASVELFFRKNVGNDELLRSWYGKLLICEGVGGYLNRLAVVHDRRAVHGISHRFLAVLDNIPALTIHEVKEDVLLNVAKRLESFG
jgi:hypothetical protein